MSLLAFVCRRTLRIDSPALHHLRFVASSSAPPSPAHRAASVQCPIPPQLTRIKTAEENVRVEQWLDEFAGWRIPRAHLEVSHSKTSGPGGQNVNKVNTKVTIRCPVNSEWMPPWVRDYLRMKSSHYAASDDTLVLDSQTHRSHSGNLKACIRKLHRIIFTAADTLRSRPPFRQNQESLRNLQDRSDARRREGMNRRTEVQNSRSPRDWD